MNSKVIFVLFVAIVSTGHSFLLGRSIRCYFKPPSSLSLTCMETSTANYYHNPVTGKCESHLWNECGQIYTKGFDNQLECEKSCRPRRKSPEFCSLPQESGPCLAYMPSFFFDPITGKCEEFIFGGCGGNLNRFRTIQDCREACIY